MTDSTDNALKPCPFCGSHGIDRDTYWHRDYCTNCGGKGPAAGNSVKAGWNTRADLAPDPLGAAKVKPLVWVERTDIEGLHEAASPIGWYYNITAERDGQFRYEGDPALATPIPLKYFPTLEAAKAAAQRDYETRIRSSLEPDTLADARLKALAEAVNEAVCLLWEEMSKQGNVGTHGGYIYMKLRPALAAFDTGDKTDG